MTPIEEASPMERVPPQSGEAEATVDAKISKEGNNDNINSQPVQRVGFSVSHRLEEAEAGIKTSEEGCNDNDNNNDTTNPRSADEELGTPQDGVGYLTGLRLYLLVFTLSVAYLLITLNTTIVATVSERNCLAMGRRELMIRIHI